MMYVRHTFMRSIGAAVRLLGCLAMLFFTAMANAQAVKPPPDVDKPVKVKVEGEELYAIGFDRLAAFEYTVIDAATGASEEEIEVAKQRDQIPGWARFYDQKRIALTGFMMPLVVKDGLSTKLIMMRDITTCCFGNVPNMNEYVIVSMKGAGVKAIQDVPVVLTGIFKISEQYEAGYLTSIFQMDGEKFLGPKK